VASHWPLDNPKRLGLAFPFREIHSYRKQMKRSVAGSAPWWLAFSRDLALLGAECAEVMARRCIVLARCDRKAGDEFVQMVGEKVAAVAELQLRLASGRLGSSPEAAARAALNHVRRKVRANRARLRR
jgi:hypothetical protein